MTVDSLQVGELTGAAGLSEDELAAKHRIHSIEFKRQVALDFIAGETLHGLAKRHDICQAQPDPNLGRRSLRLGPLMRTFKRPIFFRSTKQRSRHSNAWSAGRPSKSSF